MTRWIYFPKSRAPTDLARTVVGAFGAAQAEIDSATNDLSSNEVLAGVRPFLEEAGFRVEVGKRSDDTIPIPVLFGADGQVEKFFLADAYHEEEGFVLEVEAGRAVVNYQFLKDLFQACMMHNVEYLGIAVRNVYESGKTRSKDFDRVTAFFDALYASDRLNLPLRGILILGY